jgi:chorismate mutase
MIWLTPSLRSCVNYVDYRLGDNQMDIADWRDEIDAVDKQLVELLNKRAECALAIGKIKRTMSLPIYDPNRESTVLRQVMAHNAGPLAEDAIRRLFERIIDENRRLERIHEALEESARMASGNIS